MKGGLFTESILTSIKKLLGITEEYEHFDADIIMHINSVFSILTQLGVGPPDGFAIKDKTAVWSDFSPDDPQFSFIRSYVELRVKLMFDPPSSSSVIDAINRTIQELEWRINIAAENKE